MDGVAVFMLVTELLIFDPLFTTEVCLAEGFVVSDGDDLDGEDSFTAPNAELVELMDTLFSTTLVLVLIWLVCTKTIEFGLCWSGVFILISGVGFLLVNLSITLFSKILSLFDMSKGWIIIEGATGFGFMNTFVCMFLAVELWTAFGAIILSFGGDVTGLFNGSIKILLPLGFSWIIFGMGCWTIGGLRILITFEIGLTLEATLISLFKRMFLVFIFRVGVSCRGSWIVDLFPKHIFFCEIGAMNVLGLLPCKESAVEMGVVIVLEMMGALGISCWGLLLEIVCNILPSADLEFKIRELVGCMTEPVLGTFARSPKK